MSKKAKPILTGNPAVGTPEQIDQFNTDCKKIYSITTLNELLDTIDEISPHWQQMNDPLVFDAKFVKMIFAKLI